MHEQCDTCSACEIQKTSLLGHWRRQHRKGESGKEKTCQLLMSNDYPAREIERC